MANETYERAKSLDAQGSNDEAIAAYRDVLAVDPAHFDALNNLARLYFSLKRFAEAFMLYRDAVARHPENPVAHANFAVMLLKGDDAQNARLHFEHALRLAPENVEAHRGLALALHALGQEAEAETHRARGFDQSPFTVLPFRGTAPGLPVLLIVTQTAGNVHFESMLDNRIFAVTKVVAETERLLSELPAHAVIVNAVGDADCSADALAAAERVIARSSAPVINTPATIANTTRAEISERFAHLAGARTPLTRLLPKARLLAADGDQFLTDAGFRFPFLVRAPGFHTGKHFERIADAPALRNALATIPGDDVLAIEFIDTARRDGSYCKYRVMFVDGSLYPLHAAIGRDWKLHYFSAEMQDNALHREHDEAFLRDMPGVLSDTAMRTLHVIEAELGLDYGGIDFAIDAQGTVVIFETNATMVLPHIADDARWNYRKSAVDRVRLAAIDMIQDRAAEAASCV